MYRNNTKEHGQGTLEDLEFLKKEYKNGGENCFDIEYTIKLLEILHNKDHHVEQ